MSDPLGNFPFSEEELSAIRASKSDCLCSHCTITRRFLATIDSSTSTDVIPAADAVLPLAPTPVEVALSTFTEAALAFMADRCDCNEQCVNDGIIEKMDKAYDSYLAAKAAKVGGTESKQP